jgi:hypothetical protein
VLCRRARWREHRDDSGEGIAGDTPDFSFEQPEKS